MFEIETLKVSRKNMDNFSQASVYYQGKLGNNEMFLRCSSLVRGLDIYTAGREDRRASPSSQESELGRFFLFIILFCWEYFIYIDGIKYPNPKRILFFISEKEGRRENTQKIFKKNCSVLVRFIFSSTFGWE